MSAERNRTAGRKTDRSSVKFVWCAKCRFSTYPHLFERYHAHHGAESAPPASTLAVKAHKTPDTARAAEVGAYWSSTPAEVNRRLRREILGAPSLHPARAALLRQFKPVWADEPDPRICPRKVKIFRAWRHDETGRTLWARDFGYRAWPMWVDADEAGNPL
jgi:hypothetical protein